VPPTPSGGGRRSSLAKYKVFLGERQKKEAKRGDSLSPVP